MKVRANVGVAVCYGIAFVYALSLLSILAFTSLPETESPLSTMVALFRDPDAGPLLRLTTAAGATAAFLGLAYLSPLTESSAGRLGLLAASCVIAAISWVVATPFGVVLTIPIWPAVLLWRSTDKSTELAPNKSLERRREG